MSAARATTDHETIRSWVEARGGHPARVIGTGQNEDDPGILRIDYPGWSGEGTLEALSWNDFFDAFEDNELAFLYQDEQNSRFSKLVSRDSVELEQEEEREQDGQEQQLADYEQELALGAEEDLEGDEDEDYDDDEEDRDERPHAGARGRA